MRIEIDIDDKHIDALGRTYSYDAQSGKTVKQHVEEYFAARILSEVKQQIANTERQKFVEESVNTIIKDIDIKPASAALLGGEELNIEQP